MLPWLVHLTLVEPYCASHRMAGSSQPLSAVVDIAVAGVALLVSLWGCSMVLFLVVLVGVDVDVIVGCFRCGC